MLEMHVFGSKKGSETLILSIYAPNSAEPVVFCGQNTAKLGVLGHLWQEGPLQEGPLQGGLVQGLGFPSPSNRSDALSWQA